MSKPTGSARRWLKWGGLAACVLLAAREMVSINWLSVSGSSFPGGISESAYGEWTGPSTWTYLLVVLAILTAFEWGVAVLAWATPIPRRGRCAKCGYDLSGLPPGGACPECGKGVAA